MPRLNFGFLASLSLNDLVLLPLQLAPTEPLLSTLRPLRSCALTFVSASLLDAFSLSVRRLTFFARTDFVRSLICSGLSPETTGLPALGAGSLLGGGVAGAAAGQSAPTVNVPLIVALSCS